MKIIIIGAKGMLGQELAHAFADDKPLQWDRDEINIADQADVERKITEQQPDLVINAAAYNDVDGAEHNQAVADAINGHGPGYLARVLQASGGILVHYSTDYVFKGDKQAGYSEGDQPDPQSAYARSKFLGEQQVQAQTDKYYILRLSRLFGQPASSQQGKKSFVDIMLSLAAKHDTIQAVDEELSCPTYALDLAQRTKQIIEEKKAFGIYHTTNTGACTWYGFAKEIFRIKDIDVKLKPVSGEVFPREAERPMYSVLRNTKLPAQRSWQIALEAFLKDT